MFELGFEGQVIFNWTKMARREFPGEGTQNMKAQSSEKATHHWELQEALCDQNQMSAWGDGRE